MPSAPAPESSHPTAQIFGPLPPPTPLDATSRILIITINHSNAGFFAYVMFVLNQLRYAEAQGFVPVVHFGSWSGNGPNAFYDAEQGENTWNYFFEPVAGYTYAQIQAFVRSPEHPLTEANLHQLSPLEQSYLHAGDPESVYNYQYGYYTDLDSDIDDWFQRNRKEAQRLIQRYIRPKAHVRALLEAYLEAHFDDRPVLGIHLRGTDKGSASENAHIMRVVPPAEYFPHIDAYLEAHPEAQIYLATDQVQYVAQLKRRYGPRVLVQEMVRSQSTTNAFQTHDGQNYRKGLEVLLDCLVLAHCDYLLKCTSAVGEFAFYFNPALNGLDLNQARPRATIGDAFHRWRSVDWKIFWRQYHDLAADPQVPFRWTNKLLYLLGHNPGMKLIYDWTEQKRFGSNGFLRLLPLAKDYISLRLNAEEIPHRQVYERGRHAAQRIGSGYYTLARAPRVKYLEIRVDCHPYAAFFAQFVLVLKQLRFAEIHRLTPIVNLDYGYNYYTDTRHHPNIWENYFAPVAGLPASELQKIDPREITFLRPEQQNQLLLGEGDDPPEIYDAEAIHWWDKQRSMGARLTRDYVRIKPEILAKVDAFQNASMTGQPVLGVHLRGTDKSVSHDGTAYTGPSQFCRIIHPEEYWPFVDRYLAAHPSAKIFVATDQHQFLKTFQERYGDRVLHTRARRSKTEKAVFQRDRRGYERGLEVLIDSLLLSRCDAFLKCFSNVGEAALYFNPTLPALDLMYPHPVEAVPV